MKKYRVKSLSVSGLGNNIYRSQDIVNENNFPEGTADQLVKEGHLEDYIEPVEISEEKTEEPATGAEVEKTEESGTENQSEHTEEIESYAAEEDTSNDKPLEDNVDYSTLNIDEHSIPQIKEKLTALNIPFKAKALKTELWALLVASGKPAEDQTTPA